MVCTVGSVCLFWKLLSVAYIWQLHTAYSKSAKASCLPMQALMVFSLSQALVCLWVCAVPPRGAWVFFLPGGRVAVALQGQCVLCAECIGKVVLWSGMTDLAHVPAAPAQAIHQPLVYMHLHWCLI
jgi:hypothetical protein